MKYVVANWKQNKTLDEALLWGEDLLRLIENVDLKAVTPVICPPSPFLDKMHALLMPHHICLGVQDISTFADGAHTGFVGITQVKQFCTHAIIGHSERHEPRDLVLEKVKQCLHAGIVPIVCFKSRDDYKVIDGVIYALEDPDNISVGGVYRPKDLQEVVKLVDAAREVFGQESAVIYGGSVNAENAQNLASIKNLDGVLVGNASLNPVGFADIVRKFS